MQGLGGLWAAGLSCKGHPSLHGVRLVHSRVVKAGPNIALMVPGAASNP